MEGIVIKGYSGFYYVQAQATLWECSLRGRFRVHEQDFLPGDRVEISVLKGCKGVIEQVLPRRNSLIRPPIANVEQTVIVLAHHSPEPDLNLLDRLLIQVEEAHVAPVICFNKADTASAHEIKSLESIYGDIGYKVISTGSGTEYGIAALKQELQGKVSVFAGPSGVGKSTLVNAIQPGLALKTGEVSRKLSRGRHTTRHVELLPLEGGGFVADTPGFSSLNLPDMRREELQNFFPELDKLASDCKFSTCLHWQEPQCAVKAGLEQGMIYGGRYANYLLFLQEVIEHERRY